MDIETAEKILDILARQYPDAHCELNYKTDFQLLVAVILSAQCTDKRVNEVTSRLFTRYSTPLQFAEAREEDLQPLIRSCGFFRTKARSIISASRDIIERFGGSVPQTMEGLLSLSGVGRKTANVMLSVAFNRPAMAVDTHVMRVSRRLGLSDGTLPESIERDIVALLPEEYLNRAHHILIFFGRYCCHSRKPECEKCYVSKYCKYINNQ